MLEPVQPQNVTILVVDDEPINLMTTSECLSAQGFNILVAKKSRKVLNLVKEKLPDLILLDVYMPGINGLELCKMIKQESVCESIPIIFLTASDNDAKNAISAGGVDYIVKPFEADKLVERIKFHLNSKT